METGELLEKIISESGYSKTQFAKNADISKSFLLRVIAGEKKISDTMIEKLLSTNMITAENKKLLRENYYSDLFGKERFNKVLLTLNSINEFTLETEKRERVYVREDTLNEIFKDRRHPYVIGSKDEFYEIVSYFTKKVFENEESLFYSNYSFIQDKLDAVLYTLFSERDLKKEIDFVHVVNQPAVLSEYEIVSIFKAIKWGNIFLNTYKCKANNVKDLTIFPYYIITNDCVIIFNDDCSQSIVFSDRSTVSYYQKNFYDIKDNYSEMAKFYTNEIQLMQDLEAQSQYNFLYAIDGYLCIGPALDYEILDSVGREELPNREFLIHAVLQHYNWEYYSTCRGYSVLQSSEALKNFSKSGHLQFISKTYLKNLSPEMRAKMIENLIKLIDEKKMDFDIFDEAELDIPYGMNIDVYDGKVVFVKVIQCGDIVPDPELPYLFFIEYDAGRLSRLFDDVYEYVTKNKFLYNDVFKRKLLNDIIIKNKFSDN